MRRIAAGAAAAFLLAAVPAPALAHTLDHPAPQFTTGIPLGGDPLAGGTGADWSLISTFFTGNPHTDLDFFTQDGEIFAAVGTLAVGPNGGGQSIFQLTDGDSVSPTFVSNAPTASCVSNPSAALGLQHDVEATPKGDRTLLHVTEFPGADTRDTQLLLDATDGPGRCHDQGTLGLSGAPPGGLEIIDITDVSNPATIGLTLHIGEAHTVNVDPRRSHIAYAVSSDSVGVQIDTNDVDGDGDTTDLIRDNELQSDTDRYDLDGWEVVDLSSCMNFPDGTSIAEKRDACAPLVYRFRYADLEQALGHSNETQVHGCHELEVYPDDTLTCAAGDSLMVFDISGLFDDNGTPDDYTDDTVNGTPLPCTRRASTSLAGFATSAMIVDCQDGTLEATISPEDEDLTIPNWLANGAPSAEGITWLGSAYHMGREGAQGSVADPAFPSAEDIDFDHEAEFTHSGKFLIATDERGGGVLPGGASCSAGVDVSQGNGGIHAYRVDGLQTERPETPDLAFDAYARTPSGDKAVHRVPIRTPTPQGTFCTAHVMHQIPGQNRIFMAWYSQGTQVLDYIEHEDGTFEWVEVAWFIPQATNVWASAIFQFEENSDGTFTYYGLASDFNLGTGRSAVDVYQVTLPPPAQAAAVDEPTPAPDPTEPPPADPDPEPTTPLPATGGGVPAWSLLSLLGTAVLISRRSQVRV